MLPGGVIGAGRCRSGWPGAAPGSGCAGRAMIALAPGLRVYLACGVTDMRKGMVGLAMLVQQTLAEDPFDGAVYAFRGRRAGLIKLIWHDGVGLCMLTKRLERGQFAWPSASTTGRIALIAGAIGGAARRVRVAGAGATPQAGAGGIKCVDRCAEIAGADAAASFIIAVCRSTLTHLPDDPALLQQMLREWCTAGTARRERQAAPADPAPDASSVWPSLRTADRRSAAIRAGGSGTDGRRAPGGAGCCRRRRRQPAKPRAARPAAITAHCRRICRATRW